MLIKPVTRHLDPRTDTIHVAATTVGQDAERLGSLCLAAGTWRPLWKMVASPKSHHLTQQFLPRNSTSREIKPRIHTNLDTYVHSSIFTVAIAGNSLSVHQQVMDVHSTLCAHTGVLLGCDED